MARKLRKKTEQEDATRGDLGSSSPGSDARPAEPQELAVPKSPKFVVGIGASAGGLESLEKLFRSLPNDTGMAFVVIQHLSPDFKSMMNELLARDTQMPIFRVEDGMPVEANCVYLLPPKKEMIIAGGQLHLTDKDPQRGLTLPIDHFLESLARECGQQAVGVILSGSGSDGSRGVREIARAGGLVLCESAETAKFDSMPLSAVASGAVDASLSPPEIAGALARYAAEPQVSKQGLTTAAHADTLSGIEAIYELFRAEYDIDFSVYRDSTVLRRINRRLSLAGVSGLDAYARWLERDPAELNALYRDLLIGVTQFFRDAGAFQYLSQSVLPEIVKRHDPATPIRAWVAGCATGEEAYSLAILLDEAIRADGRRIPVKLFATDVHKSSLEFAGRGVYRAEVLQQVPEERLDRYFVRRGDSYQINPELRKSIVFAPHNLLRDAPFTDLSFVSCRNLLIYFQPAAQLRALSMFHYALNAGGLMFLGSSESPGELSSELETISENWRIFRKRRQIRLPNELTAPPSKPLRQSLPVSAANQWLPEVRTGGELHGVYDQLLDQYMPPSLLIDDRRALVDTFRGAEKLLRLKSRRPSLDVLELVDPSLRTTLSGAIQRATKENATVRYSNVKLRTDTAEPAEQSYNLTVTPIINVKTQGLYFVIALEPVGNARVVEIPREDAPSDLESSRAHIRRLEDDLRYANENLQATIEELETSNEELQASNEELVASNEELQSTNEELHSVNEELYTVNAEHQRKIGELAELNQDMQHLLEHTDVATVFLDCELRVRRFTARSSGVFDLLEQDIGRPISSFSPRIPIEGLGEKLQQVLRVGTSYETEVRAADGTSYLLRALPYRPSKVIEGVVLMLVDVSSLEHLRDDLRWLSAIVESTDDAIIGQGLDGVITSWNHGAERIYGYTAAEAIGQSISMLCPKDRTAELQDYLATILRGERPQTIDTVRIRKNGQPIDVSLTVSPVCDARNTVIGISKIARDITHRIQMVEELKQQTRQREQFLAILSHELRNPLGAILSASRLLVDKRSEQEIREMAAATIRRQATMMSTLLVDLLDVSRISQGKVDLKMERVDLNALIDAVRETTTPEMERHASRLVLEPSDEPLVVLGDAVRLAQIQVNLIHNGAKYSPAGSQIRVTLRREGDWAVISVVDQGYGIPADILPRIFEPFVQADATLDRSDGGLGVGLTLVKALVEQHGGRVEASSHGRGGGSTFRVWLPLVETEAAAATGERAPTNSTQPSAPASHANPPTSRRIVLVEDLEDSRKMLKALLELEGHDVITADCGETGVEAIRQQRPDIALIDIGLPGIDGYEVARRIRADSTLHEIYLVALTGYGQKSDVAQALESGFDTHFVKPVQPEVLAGLIDAGRAS